MDPGISLDLCDGNRGFSLNLALSAREKGVWVSLHGEVKVFSREIRGSSRIDLGKFENKTVFYLVKNSVLATFS